MHQTLALRVAIAMASLALGCRGAELTIANHSFEDPVLADGVSSPGVVGWSVEGTVEVMNPTDAFFARTSETSLGPIPIHGFNAVSINFEGRLSYQVPNYLVQPNVVYTLTLLAGRRVDAGFGNGTIMLWAGTNLVGQSYPNPPLGGFNAVSLAYTSPPAGAAIGKPLRIEFFPPTTDSQIWFDNVHLVAEEPVCTPHKATATAQLFNGVFVGATITDAGCGYINVPTVTIQGGGGQGATATAVLVDGRLSEIRVSNGGCCYSNLPTVVIDSPPRVSTVAIRFSKVMVTQSVTTGRRYVLESSFNLTAWIATGPPFIAESEVIEDEFDVNVTGRFFRLREVP
jgi:hypothetical protein